jgi:hypothetical protein
MRQPELATLSITAPELRHVLIRCRQAEATLDITGQPLISTGHATLSLITILIAAIDYRLSMPPLPLARILRAFRDTAFDFQLLDAEILLFISSAEGQPDRPTVARLINVDTH